MSIGQLGCCYDLLVGGVQLSITDIVPNSAGKQVGILQNHRQGSAQIRLFDFVDVDAAS